LDPAQYVVKIAFRRERQSCRRAAALAHHQRRRWTVK
jgi:hypothetical protein